jgi:hypothetical protein
MIRNDMQIATAASVFVKGEGEILETEEALGILNFFILKISMSCIASESIFIFFVQSWLKFKDNIIATVN